MATEQKDKQEKWTNRKKNYKNGKPASKRAHQQTDIE